MCKWQWDQKKFRTIIERGLSSEILAKTKNVLCELGIKYSFKTQRLDEEIVPASTN